MNQSKLEVVKQEMAKVNISILEARELKWTGMGEFNSDDFYANVFQLLFCSSFTVSHGQQLILTFLFDRDLPFSLRYTTASICTTWIKLNYSSAFTPFKYL